MRAQAPIAMPAMITTRCIESTSKPMGGVYASKVNVSFALRDIIHRLSTVENFLVENTDAVLSETSDSA